MSDVTATTTENGPVAKRGRPRLFVRVPVDVATLAMNSLAKAAKSVAKINPKGAVKSYAAAATLAFAMGDDESGAEFQSFVTEHEVATMKAEEAVIAATLGVSPAVELAEATA